MHMAEMFFAWFGIDVQYLRNMCMSLKNIFRANHGIYLVRLKIGLPVEGNHFDNHAMVYDVNLKLLYYY